MLFKQLKPGDIELANVCRDENCEREELHAAHEALPLRGRTPKACPSCLRSLHGSAHRCGACGWTRDRVFTAEMRVAKAVALSAWVVCPACEDDLNCPWCSGSGYVPRIRAPRIREVMNDPASAMPSLSD